jgi:hypothetical protein
MSDSITQKDGLDDNWRDRLVAVTKGAVGAIPWAGGLVAEIVGAVIPGQRADRIAEYLRALSMQVEGMSQDLRDTITSNAEKVDLIEQGGYQAARATSRERVDQIVEAVSRGLSEDDAYVIRRKRLLQLLGELDNDEVSLLNAYGLSYGGGDRMAFERINRPDPIHMQSSSVEIEQNYLFDAGKANLLRLGLLKKHYPSVRKGEVPEFDSRTGDNKHSVEISGLGRLLLKEIGMETPFDAQDRN